MFGAKPKSLEFGAGVTSWQLMQLTTKPSGDRNTTGTSFYHLHAQYHLPVGKSLISPWLHYMPDSLSAVESSSKSSKTSLLALGAPYVSNLSGVFDLSTGPVLLQYTVNGTGNGSETLNNGESSSVFLQPDQRTTSTTFAWQVGSAWNYSSFRTGADLLFQGPLSQTKRSFSLMLTAAWVKS
ncbi:hypothetical protein EBZ80_16415 [bacterium]|nr:hypothetical protein [bacterium]